MDWRFDDEDDGDGAGDGNKDDDDMLLDACWSFSSINVILSFKFSLSNFLSSFDAMDILSSNRNHWSIYQ